MDTDKDITKFQIISVMICFFVAGSIEMVGIASNYIKLNLHLSDAKANLLPSLVYVWFIICTIPTGYAINRIGGRRTVVLCMCLLAAAMFIPMFSSGYAMMILSFIVIGICNVCLQSSLYPLISNIVEGRKLADSLTLGQFIKTLSSFSAPYITMIGVIYFSHFFHLGWKVLFLFYLLVTIMAIILLSASGIPDRREQQKSYSFAGCFALLKKRFILLSFIGIMCHVGIDISVNTVAPKILMARLDMMLDKASFGASLYFIARLTGCFLWTIFLKKISRRGFFYISVALILLSLIGLLIAHSRTSIYICIIMVGLGNANLFPVIFSQTVVRNPDQKDAISVLMIMGQAGGAIFPILMGLAFDRAGVSGAISVLLAGVLYLIYYIFRSKKAVSDIPE